MFSLKRTKEWSSFSWEVYGLNQEHGGMRQKLKEEVTHTYRNSASKILLEVSYRKRNYFPLQIPM